jgi:cysteinyl-tRNA synthetase
LLRFYNSLTRQLEVFKPLAPPQVTMYVCGPTVYGLLHIGNARTFMTWDVVRRYLVYRGYSVTYVQNFTDVDDKIIDAAHREGLTTAALAQKYMDAYFMDMDALGVNRADVYPQATLAIQAMIAHIQALCDRQIAYVVDGDVYFRVRAFPEYGKLSGRRLDDAQIPGDAVKEAAQDFALWKKAKPGEPSWESPWGPGRPGWHIECSAMVHQCFGPSIDIHAGGMDLLFPHHENEIAQSESLTGKPFARYWLHTGFLNFESEKMSKSLGNIKTTRDMLQRYGAQALRVFMLMTGYRNELEFSEQGILAADKGWNNLRNHLAKLWEQGLGGEKASAELASHFEAAFAQAMDNDLNTGGALAQFNIAANHIKQYQQACVARGEAPGDCREVITRMRDLASQILGLDLSPPQTHEGRTDGLADDLMQVIITLRAEAKQAKNWPLADRIREHLSALHVQLLDHKDGSTTWRVIEPEPVTQE